MSIFSYIVKRDYGFAPNPFPPYCTLATCKPRIRQRAEPNDWVVGCGSNEKKSAYKNKIIFVMKVEEKLTFDQYWNDPRFKYKKVIIYGSRQRQYGDNIYHSIDNGDTYIQEDSHHSLLGGVINQENYNRDLKSKYVLISKKYWYWGKDAVDIPLELSKLNIGIGHRKIQDNSFINCFEDWIESIQDFRYIGEPDHFNHSFDRYDGK